MRILALITARGGSKRIPGKNIRSLGGKPLILWSIDAVKTLPEICDILVSTDDAAIAAVCEHAGAYVPWLRPTELANDTSSSVDVALHALNWYEENKGAVDGLLLLQPTSPFRSTATILRGIALFRKHRNQPVLGVSPTPAHPMWTLKMEGDYLIPYNKEHGLGTRSQDLPPAYIVSGSFYLISPAELKRCHSFIGPKTVPLVIDSPLEVLDIDTEWDWRLAEALLSMSSGDRA
ncbi:MAG TPA: acylneuraminate cytidylyltransferase family protein [Burkholderiaceae bacterium]